MAEEEGILFMVEETCNRVKHALVEIKEHVQVRKQMQFLLKKIKEFRYPTVTE